MIAVVGGNQPNTTFICEATKVPACMPQISWIHNGRNTSQTVDQRFQAYITSISGRTVRSRLNATQLRGRDSGRIDCVASCVVDVPGEEPSLVLNTFRNTTLSVLSKCVEVLVYCSLVPRPPLFALTVIHGCRITGKAWEHSSCE